MPTVVPRTHWMHSGSCPPPESVSVAAAYPDLVYVRGMPSRLHPRNRPRVTSAATGRASSRAVFACALLLVIALPVQAIATAMAPLLRPAHYHTATAPRAGSPGQMPSPRDAMPPPDPLSTEHPAAGRNRADPVRTHPHPYSHPHPHRHSHHAAVPRAAAPTSAQARHAPSLRSRPGLVLPATPPALPSANPGHASHHHPPGGIGHHRHAPDAPDVVYVAPSQQDSDPARAGGRAAPLTADSFHPLPPAWALRVAARASPRSPLQAAVAYRSHASSPLLKPPRPGLPGISAR